MSGKGYGSRDSVQAPLTLITAFGALGEIQNLGQVGPGLRRGGRRARLQDAQMVDDEARVRVAIDQRGAVVQVAPAQNIDRNVVANGGTEDAVEAGVVWIALPPPWSA